MSIHVLMLRALTLVSSFSRSNLPSISPSGVHSPLLSTPPVPPFPCLDPPSLSIPVPPPPRPPVPPSPRAPSSPPQGHESTFFSLFAPAGQIRLLRRPPPRRTHHRAHRRVSLCLRAHCRDDVAPPATAPLCGCERGTGAGWEVGGGS